MLPILTPICLPHIALSVLCIHASACLYCSCLRLFVRYSWQSPLFLQKSNENQLNIEQIFRPNDRFEIKQWAPLHQAEAPTSCRFYLSESLRSLFYPFLSLSLYSLKKSKFSILDIFISSSVSIDFFQIFYKHWSGCIPTGRPATPQTVFFLLAWPLSAGLLLSYLCLSFGILHFLLCVMVVCFPFSYLSLCRHIHVRKLPACFFTYTKLRQRIILCKCCFAGVGVRLTQE